MPAPLPEAASGSADPWAAQVVAYAERAMAQATPSPPAAPRTTTFEALHLGLVPDAVAHIVRSHGSIPESDLVPTVRHELMLGPLPDNYERLLGRLVWSAKGRRLIDLYDGMWVAGARAEGAIPELGVHSLDSLATLAAQISERGHPEDDLFRRVLAELMDEGERAPRIVSVIVGAAINLARRRRQIAFDLEHGPPKGWSR